MGFQSLLSILMTQLNPFGKRSVGKIHRPINKSKPPEINRREWSAWRNDNDVLEGNCAPPRCPEEPIASIRLYRFNQLQFLMGAQVRNCCICPLSINNRLNGLRSGRV